MHRMTWANINLIVLLITGCSDPPSGLTQPQVDAMLDIQSSVADERSELIRQTDDLNARRDDLEADRRDWARRERHDPIIAEAIGGAALLIACLLPLIAVGLLFWPRKPEPADEAICTVLIDDLSQEQPRLLPQHPPDRHPVPERIE